MDFNGERSGTGTAELEPGRVLKPTLGTAALEGSGTCSAEFHPLGIVKATAWTVHTRHLYLGGLPFRIFRNTLTVRLFLMDISLLTDADAGC